MNGWWILEKGPFLHYVFGLKTTKSFAEALDKHNRVVDGVG